VEALYRNNIETVARMLEESHGSKYQIYNLSEVTELLNKNLIYAFLLTEAL
jgi:hypothetical protein